MEAGLHDHYCIGLGLGMSTIPPPLSQSKPCLWRLKPPKTPSLLHQGKGSGLHPLLLQKTLTGYSLMDSVISPHASPKDKVQVLMVGMWQLALGSKMVSTHRTTLLIQWPIFAPLGPSSRYDLM